MSMSNYQFAIRVAKAMKNTHFSIFFFFGKYTYGSFLAHLSTMCSRRAFRVVMCPSCVVNNFFKHLLLPNGWANLDQTWQECSLGGPVQKLFTEFDSI